MSAPIITRASDPSKWSEEDRSWALAQGLIRVAVSEPVDEQPVRLPMARDETATRAVPASPTYVRNQLCWCCEERRSCRSDPDQPGRMICRRCEAM